jgi:hypothetical protein
MTILNLKSLTSAFCALAVTAFLSFSLADSFNQVYGTRHASSGFVAAVSALVR